MVEFILVILLASFVGIQIGLFTVFKYKSIAISRAILYSFGFYLLPILIMIVHVQLYNDRHRVILRLGQKHKMSAEELAQLGKKLDGDTFFVFSVLTAIKDLFSIKDNLFIFVEVTEVYNRKYSEKKIESLFKKVGLIGIISRAINAIQRELVNHASDQVILLRNRFKIS